MIISLYICNAIIIEVHNKSNMLESSTNHPTPNCPWKNGLPQNWSLVPKRLGTAGLNNRNLFSHSSAARNSGLRCLQDWFLRRPPSLACRWLSSLCAFTRPSLCEFLCPDLYSRWLGKEGKEEREGQGTADSMDGDTDGFITEVCSHSLALYILLTFFFLSKILYLLW